MVGLSARSFLVLLAGACLLALAGCTDATRLLPPPEDAETLSLSPPALTLPAGTSQQFTPPFAGEPVTWSVNGIPGGGEAVGGIDAHGLYTAPEIPPSPNQVIIRASTAQNVAAASVEVVNPRPAISSLTPTSLPAGSSEATLLVEGSGFSPQSVVRAGERELATRYLDRSQLEALVPATLLSEAGSLAIWVETSAPGGGASAPHDLRVVAVVEVSPRTRTLLTGENYQFTATVVGSEDNRVRWSIEAAEAGNKEVGTISSQGVYTAPAVVPEPPLVRLHASSLADPMSFGTVTLTLASAVEDWPKYRRDLNNTGLSIETGISSANVDRLKRTWKFDTGTKISASPAVATVDGVRRVYVGNWDGTFYAVDADAGVFSWSFAVDRVGTTNCAPTGRCRIASSPAVADGKVYFGAENAFVYALDAATGALVWKTQLGDPDLGFEIWSSPAVNGGVVYVGVASHNSAPCVVGRVVALDGATGSEVWSFDTIDQATCPSGVCLGAGVWSSPAIDTQFGILYVGTGNSGKGCAPATENATNYPDGVLALDLSTGQVKSFFQTFPDDLNDEGDIGASPALHDAQITNQCTASDDLTHWVTVPSKDSVVHTAPRGTTGLLADPTGITLNAGELIASPAVVPVTQSTPCGTDSLLTIETGNDIIVPSAGGTLFDIRQQGDGTTGVQWQTDVKLCPPENPCPLFSAPAIITDLVFFGGGEGNIYGYTLGGTEVWSSGTLGLVAGGPAISHNTLYYTSFDGILYAAAIDGSPVPVISSLLAPSSIPLEATGFTLTVNGGNFVNNSVVRWNGSDRTTTVISGSQVRAFIPLSDLAAGSSAEITVVNPSPDGGTSNVVAFAYKQP